MEAAITNWGEMGEGGEEPIGPIGDKKLIESPCWNCGKTATVPFKPDGKRPVYCLSCLKQIEAGTLIPLPERMPQVGKAKYGATLGDLGIEFAPTRPLEPQSAPAQPVRPREEPPRPRPPVAPGGAGRNFPPRRDFNDTRKPTFQRNNFPSKPIARPPIGGAKPMPLSSLKPREERRPADLELRHATPRPAIDVSELRKVLKDSMQNEKSADEAEAKNNTNIIKPGEAVKF